MRYILSIYIIIIMGCAVSARGQAANVYVTQTGAASGVCTTGVQNQSFLNNSANWGIGGTQIGPGTIVHLCGTWTWSNYGTPAILIGGDGNSGNHIHILADTGFVLQSPVFGALGNAAISNFGHSWIDIDGGGTGTGSGMFGAGAPSNGGVIKNTANGWNLANHADSNLIYTNGSNVVIKNWNLQNTCIVVATNGQSCNSSGVSDAAIYVDGASNVTVTHNSINDTMAGVFEAVGGATTGNVATFNQVWNMNWGIATGASNGANNGNGGIIQFNDIRDAVNWDGPGEHHNGVFLFTGNGGTLGATTPYLVNSNYIHGNFGVSDTSMIFNDPNGAGASVRANIVNNLMVSSTNAPANAYITGATNGSVVANNTVVHQGADNPITSQGCFATNFGATNVKYYNNLCMGARYGFFRQSGTTVNVNDYNLYNSLIGVSGNIMIDNGGSTGYPSVAAWSTATGYDVHSVTGAPNLSGTFQPLAGSAAIGTGFNLTSLGIPALNVDISGAARPASGAWTIGAYTSGGSVVVKPNPPTNVVATPN